MASGKRHPNGSSSTYTYDKAGNVTAYTSPDAGTVKTEYTPQGQIKRRTVATGRVTEYGYDGERLITIAYPDAPKDSVIYTYGDSTATDLSPDIKSDADGYYVIFRIKSRRL